MARDRFRIALRDPRRVRAEAFPLHGTEVLAVRIQQVLAADVPGGVEEGEAHADRDLEEASPFLGGRATQSLQQACELTLTERGLEQLRPWP